MNNGSSQNRRVFVRSTPPSSSMKVAEYIAWFLAEAGVGHVYALTGGGAMHLNDAFGHQPGLTCIYNHHEQACAIAAESHARITGGIGVINVTTGPGGINALTGVFGAWTDSIPMLVVSGQARRDTITSLAGIPGLRQLGDQEADVVAMARGITKYAALVTDPLSIRRHLEAALHHATSGRPGPVWLDVPVDVQGTRIDPSTLEGFEPPAGDEVDAAALQLACRQTLERLRGAARPAIMIGSGVRIAGALDVFERVVRKLGLPVTLAWTAIDALPSDHPLYCGRPGAVGDRAGNFTVQNSDVLLVIGCRLAIRQISYNWKSFARAAHKIFVDVDAAELAKPMVEPDLPIRADARLFLEELERQIDAAGPIAPTEAQRDWLAWCRERRTLYPVVRPEQREVKGRDINPYHFMERLFDRLAPGDVVVCGNASASVVAFQAGEVKAGQRVYTNAGCAAMGYDLPAAVGAAVARGGGRVVCLAGDGSLQLNIQELQTIVNYRLPVKLFVVNNAGYLSIRLTQGNFFRRFAGEGPESGVTFPDMVKLAAAYGLPAVRIEGKDFERQIVEVLATDGPIVADVMIDPTQAFEPKLSARQLPDGKIVSAALEDMAPFLSPEELERNLFIPRFEG